MKRNYLPVILAAALMAAALQGCANRAAGPALGIAATPTAPAKSYGDYINDSLTFYTAGDYQRSLEAAQNALQLQPKSAVAYNNICAAYNQLQQFDKAVEACAQALLIQPDFEQAKNNSLRAAEGARLLPAKSHDDYLTDSLTFYNAGDFQRSLEAAQSALKLQPDSAIAYNNICAAYNRLQQWDQAIAACQKALAIQPDFERAKNNLQAAQQGKQ
jgi:protein O-mannosyl-transferase